MKCTPGCALFVCLYGEIGKGLTLFSRAETLKHLSPAGCACMDTAFPYSSVETRGDCCSDLSRSYLLDFAVDEVVCIPGSLSGIFKFYVNLFVEAGMV